MTAPVMHEVSLMLKSEGLVPVIAGVFVIVTPLPVPFVRIAVMGDTKPPTGVEGNTTGLGANATTVLPVPVRVALTGLPDGPVKGI